MQHPRRLSLARGRQALPVHQERRRPRRAALLVLCLGVAAATVPAQAQEDLLSPPGSAAGTSAQPAPPPTIEPGVRPQEDEAITQRLRTIYDTVEGLTPVEVRVTSGVVVLSGQVTAQASKEQAARLARNVKGVAEVENRIEVAQDLESRLTPALKRLGDFSRAAVRWLPVLLVALAIIAAAVLLGRWLAQWRSLYLRVTGNAFLARLLAQVVQGGVLIVGAALTMLLLDATALVNTLLGAAGLVGLALGFALRDTLENYIASILLSLRRPFDPEDYVRIEGHEGFVIRLTSRATVLLTLNGNQVRIPNAMVFKGLIINFTAHPQRRFSFQVSIAPDEDLSRAQLIATEALAAVDGVLAEPPPTALYKPVADGGIMLTVAGWMDLTSHDFHRVQSEAIRVVLSRVAEAGIAAPETTFRVRRAPKAAGRAERQAGVTAPAISAIPTSRDRSLQRVVEKERTGKPDLLDRTKPSE